MVIGPRVAKQRLWALPENVRRAIWALYQETHNAHHISIDTVDGVRRDETTVSDIFWWAKVMRPLAAAGWLVTKQTDGRDSPYVRCWQRELTLADLKLPVGQPALEKNQK